MPIFILTLLIVLLSGCNLWGETIKTQGPVAAQARISRTLMQQSITATRLELPSQAPQIWRAFKQEKPALVLFSEHPFLTPIPPALQPRVSQLLLQGTAKDFLLHDSLERNIPLLLPNQTLTAALEQNLFSEIIWYFPTRAPLAKFKAENFRELMTKADFLTDAEASKLQLVEEGILEGEVKNIPLRIIHPLAALPEITHPVILHIDLGYFRGLFKNEISTPIYDLLQENAHLLRDSTWNTLAVTLSYSNEGGIYSVATRFLISNLAQLLKNPAVLESEMPTSWRMRKDSMFNQNFFQERKAQALIQQNAPKYPTDPTVQYDLYLMLIQTDKTQAAFKQLDKVVALDPGYAEEYLTLARTGQQNGWTEQTLALLDKAIAARPQNPFIRLQKAELLIKTGQTAAATKILSTLQKLTWSTTYHPDIPLRLKQRLSQLKKATKQ